MYCKLRQNPVFNLQSFCQTKKTSLSPRRPDPARPCSQPPRLPGDQPLGDPDVGPQSRGGQRAAVRHLLQGAAGQLKRGKPLPGEHGESGSSFLTDVRNVNEVKEIETEKKSTAFVSVSHLLGCF